MKEIPKQEYTAELAIKRVKEGLTLCAATKELGVNHQTLRNWIKAAAADKIGGAGNKVVTPSNDVGFFAGSLTSIYCTVKSLRCQ